MYLMRISLFALLVTGICFESKGASETGTRGEEWLYGFWKQVGDEDGTPPDVMEFAPGGIHRNYGFNCTGSGEVTYHIYRNDIYVTVEIPNKGPISIVFRPSKGNTRLTFTSPRSRNNAIYEKLPTNPCSTRT